MAIPCDMGEGASGGPWINSVNGVKDGIGGVNSQSGGFHFVDVHNPEAGVAPGCSALDELSGNCIDMISGTYLGSGASRALDDAETGRPQVYPTLG